MTVPALDQDSFISVQKSIIELCGLVIGDDQEYLVIQRIEPIMREFGIDSWPELADTLNKDRCGHLATKVVHAITTHETSFFRDTHPFKTISQHLIPSLENRIRLRCACIAVSTGQEAYSLAITLEELKRLQPEACNDYTIYATDVSAEVVLKATEGHYTKREMDRGFSEELRSRYAQEDDSGWTINKPIRDKIQFGIMNLVDPKFFLPNSDLILCRNVLIYFDRDVQLRIIAKLVDALNPGGYLLLGATESVTDPSLPVTRLTHGPTICYRKES